MRLMICFGMASEEDGSVRKLKALTVKMETVTLINKVRENVTYFVY
jgi:hypothetical protein